MIFSLFCIWKYFKYDQSLVTLFNAADLIKVSRSQPWNMTIDFPKPNWLMTINNRLDFFRAAFTCSFAGGRRVKYVTESCWHLFHENTDMSCYRNVLLSGVKHISEEPSYIQNLDVAWILCKRIQLFLHIKRKYLFYLINRKSMYLEFDRHIWRGGFLLSMSIMERYL